MKQIWLSIGDAAKPAPPVRQRRPLEGEARSASGVAFLCALSSLRVAAVLGLIAAAPTCVAARPINTPCPPTLQITQATSSVPGGWTVMPDPRRDTDHRLQGITFFSGDPRNMAALAPDTEKRTTRGYASTWHFEPNDQGYWIGCSYTDTNLLAVRKLADNISQCDMMQYLADRRRPGGAVEVVCY